MLKVTSKISFSNIERLLKRKKNDPVKILERYAQAGADALAAATPVDTGLTASSWYWEIRKKNDVYTISWNNSNIQNGIPIALIVQLGHATRSGSYVEGIDYINPALRDVFKKFSINIGKELYD